MGRPGTESVCPTGEKVTGDSTVKGDPEEAAALETEAEEVEAERWSRGRLPNGGRPKGVASRGVCTMIGNGEEGWVLQSRGCLF